MPVFSSFGSIRLEDGVITIGLAPPAAVGGWNVRFGLALRFGGTEFAVKTSASGYGGGQSGVTVLDSGQGTWQIPINSADTSGLDAVNLAGTMVRLDSGNRTDIWNGFVVLR